MRTLGRLLSSKLMFSAAVCALAISISTASFAACVSDPDTAQKAAAFTTTPSSLLQGPNGPRSPEEVAADVQTFVASYPQALPAILTILKGLTNQGPATAALQRQLAPAWGKRPMCAKPPI